MEYVAGESLAAVIGRVEASGPLDWRHILRFAVYLGRALVFAHGKGLIHRNITPHNILLGAKPQETKLADLMLATALEGDQPLPLSARGTVVGDIPYMAPETTAGGSVPVDARADLYSLGAVLYAMCAGQPPFSGETVTELVTNVRRQTPAPTQDVHPEIPEPLVGIIHRLLAKRPTDRYPSAKDLLADVEALARDEQVALA